MVTRPPRRAWAPAATAERPPLQAARPRRRRRASAAVHIGQLDAAGPSPSCSLKRSYRVLDMTAEMTRLVASGVRPAGASATGFYGESLQTLGRMKAIAEGFGVSELRAMPPAPCARPRLAGLSVRDAWAARAGAYSKSWPPKNKPGSRSGACPPLRPERPLDRHRRHLRRQCRGDLAAGGVARQGRLASLGALRLSERYFSRTAPAQALEGPGAVAIDDTSDEKYG